MTDFLIRGSLADLDPAVNELAELEAERQYRKLILIPSESSAPLAVRQALATAFHNIYAEGYPREESRWMEESELLDISARLNHFHRYSDRRYYKGTEYANLIEALARRRCAELFATNGVGVDDLYVNVQPLSGGPANNAVYHTLAEPGNTVLGLNLLHGGHLTHGSPVNRSGKYYNIVHYTVDAESERIDYDALLELALKHKPRIIIGGYSSYPWAPDWKRYREIADACGAYLFADIAHTAGLVAGGVHPSPVGYADVIAFTTHKSLCGPRGACILTTSPRLARQIDRAVFPGEQGGPHMNTIAAMAVAFKLAATEGFRCLQRQIVTNCASLTEGLRQHGFRIPYGGSDTHMTNLDCRGIVGMDGTTLGGDIASRVLDLAGIVVNRNTIPGDISAGDPSGIRMGTPWVTQRGLAEAEMEQLAAIISDLLLAIQPYGRIGSSGKVRRAVVDFERLEEARSQVKSLAEKAGIDYEPSQHGDRHFEFSMGSESANTGASLILRGERVRSFLNFCLTSDVEALKAGEQQPTCLHTPRGAIEGRLECLDAYSFRLSLPAKQAKLTATWLGDLSDGFVALDEDISRKVPGPIEVVYENLVDMPVVPGELVGTGKPYYIGITESQAEPKPGFRWVEQEAPLRRTPIFETHRKLGAKIIPFAGWEMPVWYTSVVEEHLAVRQAVGLFDVTHMGVYQVEGPDAAVFLDSVVGNDASYLQTGESCYTHFLDPDANVIDDLLVYRRGREKFLVVVNAANDDKDWAWLNAVKEGLVRVDNHHTGALAYGRNAILRNLRDPQAGAEMRVDIALQGPCARETLLELGCDPETRKRLLKLGRTQLGEMTLGGFDLIVSRTGYTGERVSFELFVHPERAEALFNALLQAGKQFGIKPCGLGARDSLRTEAGLPLYGHEMGGDFNLGVGEAGFASFVKTYKPWFIGREAFLERERQRKGEVVRFTFTEKGVRMAHPGDPVIDKRGRVIGMVTSCAVDSAGTLTGQAYLEIRGVDEGMPILIYQGAPKQAGKAPAELAIGDRITLATPAQVVRRFPKSK